MAKLATILTPGELIAICSLLTNIISLILSYLTYKESRAHPLLTPQMIFTYKAYAHVTATRFQDTYILYAIILVHYTA